jgi:hypothetical protein
VTPLPDPPTVYLNGGLADDGGAPRHQRNALLELPYWCCGGDFWVGTIRYETLYFQSLHQRPIVGGHHSRISRNAVSNSVFDPTLRYLSHVSLRDRPAPPAIQTRSAFQKRGIRYVNITRSRYRREDETELISMLTGVLGAELIHEDQKYLTYRIPIP